MPLLLLLFTLILAAAPATAGQSAASSKEAGASSGETRTAEQASADQKAANDKAQPAPAEKARGELPVSLDRIRGGLKQDAPLQPIRGLKEQAAHFRVEVLERQKIEELLATLTFKAGPVPAGGIYAYEQQRLTRPPTDNPLAQPYAAFNTGELLTVAIENLIVKYLGGRALDAVTSAERARAEESAREEVAQAMAGFCAAQPNRGAGLRSCDVAPAR